MRKTFYLVLNLGLSFLLFLNLSVKAQNITLTTQAQVDAFNQTSVAGNLTVSGSISNLNGLSELQTVGLSLEILSTFITNIDALSNLQSIGHSLRVSGNSLLTNVNGFSSLTSVARGIYFINDPLLTNYDGLLNITSTVEGINVNTCPIVNLNGFSNINAITGFIEMQDNPALTSLDGLESVSITGVLNSLKINNNDALQNINGLTNIKDAGGIQIMGNGILPNIDGLSNLETLESMIIENNPALTNIDGLSKITATTGSLFIRGNNALLNINGLSNVTVIGKELILGQVPNVGGLSKLTKIGTNLIIGPNPNLINLNGLEKLLEVGKDLSITNNSHLVDFCGLYNLFHSGTIVGTITIKNNGANTIALTTQPITVNADPGLCSATLTEATIGTPTRVGCLEPFTSITHSDFPEGLVFQVGQHQITWTVSDGAGNTATATQTVTVVDNQVPVITCPVNITVKCASDVPDPDVNTVTATDNCSVTKTHVGDVITNQTCANRFTLTRTYKATDPAGNSATCSQVITVYDDVPPQINGLTISQTALWPPNHTMRDIVLTYTATDNCVNTPTVSITVSSNEPVNGTADGDTDPDWEVVDDHHIKLRAERAATGNGRLYTITITVDDGCNAPVTQSKTVFVAHNITGPQAGASFKIGSTVSFSGVFQDKQGNKHTAKWLLDGAVAANGSVTEPSGNQNGKVTGSYKFNTAGVYKLQMNVTDQTGVTTYANTNNDLDAIVVIYDPNGGYAYGGGWYPSQAGALINDPSATGKASYGFAVNYRNAAKPKGETQIEFKVGSFEFNALNFEYLSVAGAKAQFRGTGKIIGGQSGVSFIMTVSDGALDGTGIDKIRMKIFKNGQVYYDNQPGASDADNPTTAVGSNSIIFIQGTAAGSSITSLVPKEKLSEETIDQNMKIIAYPNPSTNNFSLTVQADTKEKITLQVMDMYGRIIEARNIMVNSIVKLGDRYRPGAYIVRLFQGKEHKEIKLIKLSD